MNEDQLPDFSRHLIFVYLKGAHSIVNPVGHLMHRAELKRYGDRLFLVGLFATPDQRGWEGVPTGIAWDCVEKYVLFHSIEEFQARQNGVTAALPQKKSGWFG
jgi:hypothetical protein